MVDVAEVLAGDARGVARALTLVERGGREAEELLGALRGRLGRARTVGITGRAGGGKEHAGRRPSASRSSHGGARVAVLAVDPSSPFSGGALLGDRVRMPDFLERGGVVRSMATRGALGGLAVAASDALDVLDAAGFDWVLVETVGVGQDEVEIAGEVETVVLVTVAGMGDDVQAAKAGVMEIADIFAVNKADRPGAEGQVAAIEGTLALAPSGTVAASGHPDLGHDRGGCCAARRGDGGPPALPGGAGAARGSAAAARPPARRAPRGGARAGAHRRARSVPRSPRSSRRWAAASSIPTRRRGGCSGGSAGTDG